MISSEAIRPYLDYFTSFGLSSNVLFGVLFLVFLLVWGLSLGRTRSVISLLSIYVAFSLERLFPYFEELKNAAKFSFEEYYLRIGLFLAAFIVVFLVFNYSFIRRKFSSADFSLFSILLIGFFQVGLLASIIASFLPPELTLKLLGPAYSFIGTPEALFLWSVVPIAALLFL